MAGPLLAGQPCRIGRRLGIGRIRADAHQQPGPQLTGRRLAHRLRPAQFPPVAGVPGEMISKGSAGSENSSEPGPEARLGPERGPQLRAGRQSHQARQRRVGVSSRRERLNQILEDAHAADIAAALRELPLPDQVTLFRLLGRESAEAVLAELGDQAVHELAGALDEGEISSILDRMRPDDAAQVLEELPAEQAEKVLDLMREEKSEEVQGLLEYGEKTAGRLMTPDMLAVLEYVTVAQAVEQVRKSPVAETAPVLYVVDDHDHLVGSLPWRRLITADPTAPVGLLRQEEPVSVTPETDQE